MGCQENILEYHIHSLETDREEMDEMKINNIRSVIMEITTDHENDRRKRGSTITLIGKRQARKGHIFIYSGPISECRECTIKNICFNLEKGHRYRIVEVRDKEHNCGLFDEKVRVVSVEQVPFHVGIAASRAIEGSVITFQTEGCGSMSCEHYQLTHPPCFEHHTRIKILHIMEDVVCKDGSRFKKALVDFAD